MHIPIDFRTPAGKKKPKNIKANFDDLEREEQEGGEEVGMLSSSLL